MFSKIKDSQAISDTGDSVLRQDRIVLPEIY